MAAGLAPTLSGKDQLGKALGEADLFD